MKHLTTTIYAAIIVLLLLVLFSCTKPARITRSTPKFSLKYNGTYTESNDASVIFYHAQKPDNTFEYYIAIPCETTYLQMHLYNDVLAVGTDSGRLAMIWTGQYFQGAFEINFTTITTTATGTFSGALWDIAGTDTLHITDGNFLNINFQ